MEEKKLKTIKEYEVVQVKSDWEDTEKSLNRYAEKGWKVICSYAGGRWFVVERDKQLSVCPCCGN